MKTRIYIAGKITGLADLNQPKFEAAEQYLKDLGYEVINPLKLNHSANTKRVWEEYMRVCIGALVTCTEIALLDDWAYSKGANIEFQLTRELNMKYHLFNPEVTDIIMTNQ